MKCFSLFTLVLSAGLALAQDPGFQPAVTPPRTTAPAPAPLNRTDEAKGAALLDSMDRLDGTTLLQIDDKISFRIVEEAAPPISIRVKDSGDIEAPYVGLVRAAAKTPKALAQEVKKMLEGSYFRVATVIIALDERPQPVGGRPRGTAVELEYFTIFGQVIRQGKYELPYNEDVTVSQAILRAGGFSQFAKKTAVKVIRTTPQGSKSIKVNVKRIMEKGALEKDFYIRNNDVLIIQEAIVQF
jgi:polysaccharide biosynthesis/export protein